MELNELKNLVNQAKTNEERRQQEERERMENLLQKKAETMQALWGERVKNWLETLNFLAEEGYIFSSRLIGEYARIPDCQKGICTDGFYHTFGLHGGLSMRGVAPTHYDFMGIDEGGACGEWDIYTDGEHWFAQHRGYKTKRPLTIREYISLESKIPIFEEKYNRLINTIKAQAFNA